MSSLLAIGECMMELNAQGDQGFSRAFAGDTYNSAVYAKRWNPELKVSMLSAVGNDTISNSMLEHWSREGIDYSLVPRSQTAHPGIYAITTDDKGERSFLYWRKQSAATQMMTLLQANGGAAALPDFDYVYFSGLSLAILEDDDKAALLELAKNLRQRGAKIVFDPNYRPKMWRDLEHATSWMQKSYTLCDIALPGLEDHEALFGQTDQQSIYQFLQQYGCSEVVIKCGALGVFAYGAGAEPSHLPFTPAPKQLDSTAAGDSFGGTYLAARMSGAGIGQSVANAASIAGLVVQHRGAIIDRQQYQAFRDSL